MKKVFLIGGAFALLAVGAAMAHVGKGHHGRYGGHHGGYHGHHGGYDHHRGGPGRRGARLEERFKAMDADGDGLVTAEEMEKAKAERFKKMDANGDGVVDARELVDHRMLRRAERRIKRLDKNDDGKLQIDELPDRRRLTRFDLNNDGAVSRAEIDLAMKHRGGRRGWDRDGEKPGAPDAAPKPDAD